EKKRYEKHNNDVNDPGYRKFVEPIVLEILNRYTPMHKGLDYGCGPGPVVAEMLKNKGYSVELYDPYFCDNREALKKKYDFIICCEVIEHFNSPAKDFERLRDLLNPGGALFCMTELYSENTDFKNWHYSNDPTHVFFYHTKTLSWIKAKFAFNSLESNGRVSSFIS
ncbi:MAG: class I SAM-dependent methyltransferase, partial [Candidatus Omnitrophica bacterium]|nr:class I SAM-dependent methyltransferase [Candidatus Omnitrophota bacterium]